MDVPARTVPRYDRGGRQMLRNGNGIDTDQLSAFVVGAGTDPDAAMSDIPVERLEISTEGHPDLRGDNGVEIGAAVRQPHHV